ncbi:MAG: helicase-related protein, partial [Nitrospirota bacterium]|nr:helicase-related protein [Nitrospirota bacterium]
MIEKLMNTGHLEVIFSTSTVAAGVNFPARTVVLVQSDRFNGREFLPLTSTELHQMIGRAGRRGKDNVGFALILPGHYQDPLLVHDLLHSPPESIVSQININFSMALNLLLSHNPEQIKDLLEMSFAAHLGKRAHQELETRWNRLKEEMHQLMPELSCEVGAIALIPRLMEKQRTLKNEMRRLKQLIHEAKKDHLLMPFLKPGRIFQYRGKSLYVLFETFVEGTEMMCAAQRLSGAIRMLGGQIKLKKILIKRISKVYDYRVDLPEDLSKRKLKELFAKIPFDQLQLVEPPTDLKIPEEDELKRAREELRHLLEEESPHLSAY